MLVSFTGRRTGRRYWQPLSYVQDGNTLLTPGGGNWKPSCDKRKAAPGALRRSPEPIRKRLRPVIRSSIKGLDSFG